MCIECFVSQREGAVETFIQISEASMEKKELFVSFLANSKESVTTLKFICEDFPPVE